MDDHFLIARFERTDPGKRRPALGLALRVDLWRETVNDRSPIVGVVVREVYAKKGIKTDIRPGDIILVDDNGEIAEKTKDGKEVPAIFRNEENKAKISILIAQREQKLTGSKRIAA